MCLIGECFKSTMIEKSGISTLIAGFQKYHIDQILSSPGEPLFVKRCFQNMFAYASTFVVCFFPIKLGSLDTLSVISVYRVFPNKVIEG